MNKVPETQKYNYSQGKSISLSEALWNSKVEFDKDFVKHVRASGNYTNGTTPIYQKKGCLAAHASLSLKKTLSRYFASLKFSSRKRSFNVDVGSVSFHFETTSEGVEVSAAGSKPVLISKDTSLHSNVNIFSVISKDGKTQAFCNGALITTIPNLTQISGLSASAQNHRCSVDHASESDKIYDISITEYLVN